MVLLLRHRCSPHRLPPWWKGPLSRLGLLVPVLMLVLCLGVHGMALAVQRAGGRLHFHLPMAGAVEAHAARSGVVESAHDRGHHLAAVDPAHEDDHVHVHHHSTLAEHAHAIGDASVVHADAGDPGLSPSPPAPPLRVHELDGLLIRVGVLPNSLVRAGWPPEAALLIRSFISGPLERPPKV